MATEATCKRCCRFVPTWGNENCYFNFLALVTSQIVALSFATAISTKSMMYEAYYIYEEVRDIERRKRGM